MVERAVRARYSVCDRYQPCQVSGSGPEQQQLLANSHAAVARCHVAVHLTRELGGLNVPVALNYRLSNFYYSMLEFALSWNPQQLMAEPDYTYECVTTTTTTTTSTTTTTTTTTTTVNSATTRTSP